MKRVRIDNSWEKPLQREFDSKYMKELGDFLRSEKTKGKKIFPLGGQIFNSFNLTKFDEVKAVIIGQDPYHGEGQAHGLSFSVQRGTSIPPSLRNIFLELENDLNISMSGQGNLEKWSKQGVLLLNSCLTVEKNRPGSHQGIGWEKFTDSVLCCINDLKKNVVFILWGKKAKEKEELIDKQIHLVISSSHPSPFSAHYGFFGSKPFSKTNAYLIEKGLTPIDWTL